MGNNLIAGPASKNIVVYTQSGRGSYYGAIFEISGTTEKIVYGFEKEETLWQNQVKVIPAPNSVYAEMCARNWWNGFIGGTDGPKYITAKIFGGRMLGNVCELNFEPSKAGHWIPLSQVMLLSHFKAKDLT